MATKKVTSTTYQVSARLTVDVSMEIQAASLQEATTKAMTLNSNDFLDFKAQGLDLNDSEPADVYGIWRL